MISGEISAFSGSTVEFSGQKSVGYVPGQGVGLAVDYTFNSEEARKWLNSNLAQVGWQPLKTGLASLVSLSSMSTGKKIGLVFAGIGVLVTILGAIVIPLLVK